MPSELAHYQADLLRAVREYEAVRSVDFAVRLAFHPGLN